MAQVVDLGSDLNIYTVGEGPDAVIWNYNIEGFNGGRWETNKQTNC